MFSLNEYKEFVSTSLQPWIAGRYGFGAFQHFSPVRWHSVRCAEHSYYVSNTNRGIRDCQWHHKHDDWRSHIEWLLDIETYRSKPIWGLFWALSKAEHNFLERYTKAWSHEERLTGHLITQIIDRIDEFAPAWRILSQDDPKSRCDVWYSDLSTNRMEKITGSDFGIVFHIVSAQPGWGTEVPRRVLTMAA